MRRGAAVRVQQFSSSREVPYESIVNTAGTGGPLQLAKQKVSYIAHQPKVPTRNNTRDCLPARTRALGTVEPSLDNDNDVKGNVLVSAPDFPEIRAADLERHNWKTVQARPYHYAEPIHKS